MTFGYSATRWLLKSVFHKNHINTGYPTQTNCAPNTNWPDANYILLAHVGAHIGSIGTLFGLLGHAFGLIGHALGALDSQCMIGTQLSLIGTRIWLIRTHI